MSLRGIRGTLSNFLAAGGHISAGISKALGSSRETINNYISRHIIGPSVGTVDYINSLADDGIAAAEYQNTLPRDVAVDLGRIPTVPEQYGDEPDGRRITTAVIVNETEDDPGKLWRIDFPDAYTLEELENIVDMQMALWKDESPEAFTKEREPHIRTNAIRQIYTSKRF